MSQLNITYYWGYKIQQVLEAEWKQKITNSWDIYQPCLYVYASNI